MSYSRRFLVSAQVNFDEPNSANTFKSVASALIVSESSKGTEVLDLETGEILPGFEVLDGPDWPALSPVTF